MDPGTMYGEVFGMDPGMFGGVCGMDPGTM